MSRSCWEGLWQIRHRTFIRHLRIPIAAAWLALVINPISDEGVMPSWGRPTADSIAAHTEGVGSDAAGVKDRSFAPWPGTASYQSTCRSLVEPSVAMCAMKRTIGPPENPYRCSPTPSVWAGIGRAVGAEEAAGPSAVRKTWTKARLLESWEPRPRVFLPMQQSPRSRLRGFRREIPSNQRVRRRIVLQVR